MITAICYWFWILWDVEVENVNAVKGMFATFSVFELFAELTVLCFFIGNIINFIKGIEK